MEKLTKISNFYKIMVNIIVILQLAHSNNATVRDCTRLYATVRDCTRLYATVCDCTRLYATVHHVLIYKDVQIRKKDGVRVIDFWGELLGGFHFLFN